MILLHSHRDRAHVASPMTGLASLEFILALPLLLVIFLLLVNVVSLSLTRLEVLAMARNTTFEAASGLSRLYQIVDPEIASNGEPIFTDVTRQSLSQQSDFLPFLRRAECVDPVRNTSFNCDSYRNSERTRALNQQNSRPTIGQASAFFFGDRPLGIFDFVVDAEFAAFAEPIWNRASMRLGYDQYLDRDLLRTNETLPNAFPGT